MNVAYHSSDAYSRMLGISITSLLENNRDMDEINIYVIEKKICKENKKLLVDMVTAYSRNIFFIPMPDINKQEHLELVKVKEKWAFDSYCRLFLDKILPENVSRVLYLDSDVLVANSVHELWNIDLKGHCAAASKDCISKKYYSLLGLSDNTYYCNSGVILYDLECWKCMQMEEAIKKYIASQNGYIFFMEQTVLNAVMDGKWHILDARYNVSTLMMALSYDEITTLRKPYNFYSKIEVENAVCSPCLIHMTSVFIVNNRAWVKGSNHPAVSQYKRFQQISPWAEFSDLPDNRNAGGRLIELIVKIIPKVILLPIMSFIYNTIRVRHIYYKMKKGKR